MARIVKGGKEKWPPVDFDPEYSEEKDQVFERMYVTFAPLLSLDLESGKLTLLTGGSVVGHYEDHCGKATNDTARQVRINYEA